MPLTAVEDVQKRWRTLTSEESARVEVLIEDAEVVLRSECPGLDARIEAATLEVALVRAVVCGMVKRAMIGGAGDMLGVSSVQQGAGPFSQGLTYSNPMGDLYLTRADRRRLGFAGQKAFSVDLAPFASAPPLAW